MRSGSFNPRSGGIGAIRFSNLAYPIASQWRNEIGVIYGKDSALRSPGLLSIVLRDVFGTLRETGI
jgi:hypothetical protein